MSMKRRMPNAQRPTPNNRKSETRNVDLSKIERKPATSTEVRFPVVSQFELSVKLGHYPFSLPIGTEVLHDTAS